MNLVFKKLLKKLEVRIYFSTNLDYAIEKSEIIFMAVNTPTKEFGEGKGMATDLTFVEECSKENCTCI